MKKKKWKTPLILLLIFAVLLIVYAALKAKNKAEEEKEESGISVTDMNADDVSELSFQTGGETVTFSKDSDSGEWKNTADENFPVNKTELEQLVDNLVSLEAERKLTELEDLSEYGLEEPSGTVTLTDTEGEQTKILLGNENQTTGAYYIGLASDPSSVYVTETDVASLLPENVMELAEYDAYPSINSSDILEIDVEKTEGSYQLVKDEEESEWRVTGEDGTAYTAEYQSVSSLASTVSGIVYSSLADYDAEDLSVYGLDSPAATVRLKYEEEAETEESDTDSSSSEKTDSSSVPDSSEKDEPEMVEKELTLYIGNQDENGNYYVRLDGSGQVNTVAQDTLSSLLENTSVSYWSRSICYASLNIIESVQVTCQGQIRTIIRHAEETENEDGETEETVSYTSGDTNLDQDKTEAFLYAMNEISAQSKDPSLASSASAELVIEVTTENGTFTVSYTPYDENFYLAVDDEGRPGLVNKNNINELIEKYDAIWS